MPGCSLKRSERIRSSADFVRIYRKGAKKESRHFKVAYLANNLAWSRLGITVGRKIGGAVQRNHVKRRIREYFRLHKSSLPASSDIVFTAKQGASQLSYATMMVELDRLLDSAFSETETLQQV